MDGLLGLYLDKIQLHIRFKASLLHSSAQGAKSQMTVILWAIHERYLFNNGILGPNLNKQNDVARLLF